MPGRRKSFNRPASADALAALAASAACGLAACALALPASWGALARAWGRLRAFAAAAGAELPGLPLPAGGLGGGPLARLAALLADPACRPAFLSACGAALALCLLAGALSALSARRSLRDGTWVGGARAPESTHGDARIASSPREVRAATLGWAPGRAPEGGQLAVGSLGRGLRLAEVVHAAVLGRSGDGKSRRVVVPSVAACLLQGDSVVVNDPKGELFRALAPLAGRLGTHRVVRVAFDDPPRSARFDPLGRAAAALASAGPGACVRELRELSRCAVPRTLKGQQYFSDAARNLFVGLALYALSSPGVPEGARNLGTVLALASPAGGLSGPERVGALLASLPPGDPAAPFLSGVCGEGGGGPAVVNTLCNYLVEYCDGEVAPMLCGDEVLLDRVGEEPTLVFVSSSAACGSRGALANTLFSQALSALRSCAARHGGRVPVRTVLLMDEFAGMGRCERLLRDLGEMRSEGVSVVACWQSFHQLEVAGYSREEALLMLDLMGDKLVLSCGDLDTARTLSESMGSYTALARGESRSRGPSGGSAGSSLARVRRPLVAPAELMEWSAAETGALLIRSRSVYALASRDLSETFVARLVGEPLAGPGPARDLPEPPVWAGPAPAGGGTGEPGREPPAPPAPALSREYVPEGF